VKVLILHQHFNTPEKGGAIRSYYLAKALVDAGIETIVITAHNEKTYKTEPIDHIQVHYLPVAYNNRFGFGARSYSFLKYVWGAVRLSAPLTVGLAAMWIKQRDGIPYIFEVGDLWPDAPIQLGFVKNFFFQQVLYGMEKSIYQSADSVVALSWPIKSAISKKVPRKIIHVVPNMSDTDFFKLELKLPALEEKFGVKGKFVVSYIGAIGVANGLDYFIECANTSRKAELPIQFLMCGDGALLDRLKGHAHHLGLHNLSFIDFTNREGVKEIMNITDAVFVCYKNVPILETGSPNKYFDGLAAGKLIVINFGGWIKNEVNETRCGIYVDPLQPTDFIKKLRPFISDGKLLVQFQQSASGLAEKKYSRRMTGESFVRLFQAK
jgi:glycosyltransferase involved in cell wall biosynthesis